MYYNWFWGGAWFGWIFWIVIFGIIIWLLISQSHRKYPNDINPHLESPLDILKKRYAKGEITKEQFEQMKKDIE